MNPWKLAEAKIEEGDVVDFQKAKSKKSQTPPAPPTGGTSSGSCATAVKQLMGGRAGGLVDKNMLQSLKQLATGLDSLAGASDNGKMLQKSWSAFIGELAEAVNSQ